MTATNPTIRQPRPNKQEMPMSKHCQADKALDLASLLALKVPVDPIAAKDPNQRDAQIRMRGHIHSAIRAAMK